MQSSRRIPMDGAMVTAIPHFPFDSRYRSRIQVYLADVLCDEEYVRLLSLKSEGWTNEHMESHFQKTRQRAHTYEQKPRHDPIRDIFFTKGKSVMKELDEAYGLISHSGDMQFMDLCCCPGGFSQHILDKNMNARGHGFSLPPEIGGHQLAISGSSLARWQITYQDVLLYDFYTRFLPDDAAFSTLSNSEGNTLCLQALPDLPLHDFVVADGQFLRKLMVGDGIEVGDKPYASLIHAQLILALTFLRPGGTLVFKLTHCDRYSTIRIIQRLQSISGFLDCYKPTSCWSDRSSFYVIAKSVRTNSPECHAYIKQCAEYLRGLMLDTVKADEEREDLTKLSDEMIGRGEVDELVPMFKKVWKTQANRLEQMLRQRWRGRGGF